MTRQTKTLLIALGVFVAYILVAVILAFALKLHGIKLWQMTSALALLGLISAGLLLYFMRADLRTPVAGSPAGSVDAMLAAARAQLAAERRGNKPAFGALPVLLVLGPNGSTKTTTIIRSGLDPELLAGDVFRGETVAPTAGVNVWFAQGTVVVEAGGPLIDDVPAWLRLVRSLRPRSLRSALTGRAQSPRLAVVCFGCDEFYKPGSGEAVPAAARSIRARLGEATRHFGVRLPTYVLFTKLDAIPHFDAYTRNLSNDEARDPLGAAVLPDTGGAGTYADRVTPALDQAFGDLFASVAERRLQALAREPGAEWKPGAYEFPREFNKIRPLAVEFLREIGRPSELEVSPVLRGFYFTGVQAVFVTDTATPEYAPPPQPQVAGVRSATAVFSAPTPGTVSTAPAAGAGARKVPRWNFLSRVMREVVFGDQAAVRLTSAGARVGFWRRLGLAAATVIAIAIGVAFIWSYSGNRKLQTYALDATRGIAELAPNPVDLPPADALQKLDALRLQLDTLSSYTHEGAPTRLRWGLYSGSRLYPDVRNAYFGGFNKLMFAGTRASMLAALRALLDTPQPTDDYGATYSLLKAYIITTSHPEKSTVDFLAPALMTRWLAGRPVDSLRALLARRQFVTYANELRYANPFPDTADAAAVAKARTFLRQFAGSERIYQFMLAEAGKPNPSVQFNRKVAGSAPYVVDAYEVPGAFTKGGSVFMLNAFKTVDKYLSGENWVVGDGAAGVDKAKLVADLRARYVADYVAQWRKFLSSASVAHYGGVKDAAQKLAILSGNQSPLLALFSVASQNTDIGIPEVTAVFQPVQLITPPAAKDKLIGDGNAPYVNALLTLQSSLDQTANAQGPAAEQAAGQAAGNATAARTAARQIAAGFNIDQQGQVHSIVQNLMEAPIAYAEPLLRNFGAAEINVRARAFCAAARPLLAKFPFAPDATQQASLAEVAAVLRPGSGSLWRFYDDALVAALPRQGNQFVPNAGGSVKLTPGFVTFLNRAAAFSTIMFKDESPEPHLSFTLQPTPSEPFSSVSVSLDGEVIRSTVGGNVASARIDWPGAGREAKLSAGNGGPDLTMVGPYNGPWAVFQLFNAADEWKQGSNGYRVGWELATRAQRVTLPGGQSAKIIVQMDNGPATTVLRKGFFAGSQCAGDIAR
jgi:type VI secretion system protein ImpL